MTYLSVVENSHRRERIAEDEESPIDMSLYRPKMGGSETWENWEERS